MSISRTDPFKTAQALEILAQEETAIPDDAHTPYVRAAILARHGRYAEARLAANRALTLQHDFQPALELLRDIPGNK